MKIKAMAIWFILTMAGSSDAWAIPQILNFQGRLTESGLIINGPKNLTFRIYDIQTGGTPVFTEEHVNSNAVIVTSGIVNVLIGGLTSGGIPQNVFNGNEKFLEIEVNGAVLPRQRIASAGYAFRSSISNFAENASTAAYAERAHYVDDATVVNITTITAVSINVTSITVSNIAIYSATVEGTVSVGGGVKVGHSILLGAVDPGADNNIAFTNGEGVIKTMDPGAGILKIETAADKDIIISPGNNLGLGTLNPIMKLDVNGGIRGSSITATAGFYGDGANLTGLTASQIPGIVVSTNNPALLASTQTFTGTNSFQTIFTTSTCIGGDCRTSWPSFSGDSLGTHVATQALNMAGYSLNSADNIAATGNVTAARYQISGNTILQTPGSGNLFVGSSAGLSNRTGSNNSFFGYAAGQNNYDGGSNTFVGELAGNQNTSGSGNSFIGTSAGMLNSTGNSNTFIGSTAGNLNNIGESNTFVGGGAGSRTTSGSKNTMIGASAGLFTQTGSANVILGEEAGYGRSNNSFSSATLVGYRAGYYLADGSNNILIGFNAGDSLVWGASNIIIGYDQDSLSSSQNNFLNIGGVLYGDISAKTLGISRTVPEAALDVVSTGTAPGDMAQIWRNSIGVIVASMSATGVLSAQRFIGDGSGLKSVAGDSLGDHTATKDLIMSNYSITAVNSIGVNSMSATGNVTAARYQISGNTTLQTPGSRNLFVGNSAGQSNTTGSGNLFVGSSAGQSNTTGLDNSFMGANAGSSNISGQDNTFIGTGAGGSNTFGFANTFVGAGAGNQQTTGAWNSIFGYTAGSGLTTGNNNLLLGREAGSSISSGNNNIIIGRRVGTLNPADSYVLNIASAIYGNLQTYNIGIGSATPQARLVVASGAGESGNMLVISTGDSNVIRMTGAGEIYANKYYYGDGSALTGVPAPSSLLSSTNTWTAAQTLSSVTVTTYLALPAGTTDQRPGNRSEGAIRYNTSLHKPEYYNGTKWMTFMVTDSDVSVTGGSLSQSGGYNVRTFTYPSTGQELCISGGYLQATILIVAGGGGGGYNMGGGGGSGGVYTGAHSLAPGCIGITVGSPGTGSTNGPNGSDGGPSSFGAIVTAYGGGKGGSYNSGGTGETGFSGGSGGGGNGAGSSRAGGAGTSGQGYGGGIGSNVNSGYGGGGGGASQAGANSASSVGGNGGDGKTFSFSGSVYGGGGGGGVQNGTAGTGGTGGGGSGGNGPSVSGGNGTIHTGGGGGGGGNNGGAGGNGGSGIVQVWY